MRQNPIVGQKFTIGAGPKPVVDKINSYFDATNSIAKALNLLLDRFDHISFQEYRYANAHFLSRLVFHSPTWLVNCSIVVTNSVTVGCLAH